MAMDHDNPDMDEPLRKRKKSIGPDQHLPGQTAEQPLEPNEESAEQDFKSVIKYLEEELGDDLNIDQLIQCLMIQNKDLNQKMG